METLLDMRAFFSYEARRETAETGAVCPATWEAEEVLFGEIMRRADRGAGGIVAYPDPTPADRCKVSRRPVRI
jgi:hypothetical protein